MIYLISSHPTLVCCFQIISGVGVLAYWASTFVFDIVTYLIPFAVFLGLLYIFDVQSKCWSCGLVAMPCLGRKKSGMPLLLSFHEER